jgi:hypothetical protein
LRNWLAASDSPDPEAVGELLAALSDEDPEEERSDLDRFGGVPRPNHGGRLGACCTLPLSSLEGLRRRF